MVDLNNSDFYNEISNFYDEMISVKESEEKKIKLYTELFFCDNGRAADLGCGSGIDSYALYKCGYQVDGFDSSGHMITKAKEKYTIQNEKINFHNQDIISIPKNFTSSFDLILSMGNTFANISNEEFGSSLKKIYELLKTGASAFIQIINYKKIIDENKRILNIKKKDGRTIIRFYDYEQNFIRFNILTFSDNNPINHSLVSTKLFPHQPSEFIKVAESMGFDKPNIFSDLKENIFDENRSANLLVKLTK